MTRFAQRRKASFRAEETDEKRETQMIFFFKFGYQGGKLLESNLKDDENGTILQLNQFDKRMLELVEEERRGVRCAYIVKSW